MGNFYTNYTLRGPSQQAVAAALAGRAAFVTPAHNGSVVVFDEKSESQDLGAIAEFAARLSREFDCPVLALLNHDDDILWYQLYLSGELTDRMIRRRATLTRPLTLPALPEATPASSAARSKQAMLPRLKASCEVFIRRGWLRVCGRAAR
jgi:hypothetical protein